MVRILWSLIISFYLSAVLICALTIEICILVTIQWFRRNVLVAILVHKELINLVMTNKLEQSDLLLVNIGKDEIEFRSETDAIQFLDTLTELLMNTYTHKPKIVYYKGLENDLSQVVTIRDDIKTWRSSINV